MRNEDWDKLCRNIHEGKCILFLGPEFPLTETEKAGPTTFSKLLSQLLREEIRQFDNLPGFISAHLEERELSQLAGDYVNQKSRDKKDNRNELEILTTKFLNRNKSKLESEVFSKLAALPFTFIVNTNYTNFFSDALAALGKTPNKSYYNYRGKKIDLVESVTGDDLGTQEQPFVFNLFGSVAEPSSLVLSENDLVQFVINLISKNPGLPANVKSSLADQEKSFLFLGFGFLAKSWYFRILLQALESNNKGRMSYALECIDNIANNEDPTVLFFRDELMLRLYRYDQREFVDTLLTSWKRYLEEMQIESEEGGGERKLPDDAPRAFISYKSDDFAKVNSVGQRLKDLGVDVWLDRERLEGKWEDHIADTIASVNAFVLMQSKSIKEGSPENYVHVEIKKALKRAERFANEADFIFPCCIDDKSSALDDYDMLRQIQLYDLTKPETLNKLASDIKRSYARNKRKQPA